MKVPLRSASRSRRIVCPFCESGELVSLGPGFARCGSCGIPLLGSALGTLREIVGLPDALGSHPCECGHPEMRELPEGVFHCPACGAEVFPIRKPRPGSAWLAAGGIARFVPDGDRGAGRQEAKGA
jgi:ribosomal protein L37AE/L43A